MSYNGAVFASAIPGDVETARQQEAPEAQAPQQSDPRASSAPSADVPPLTREQLAAMYRPAPAIGQDVGLFEIAEMT